MKKENVFGLLFYLIVLGVAVLYGFTVLQGHFQYSYFKGTSVPVLFYALYIIATVFIGVFATGLFQELGHLLGAKTGGYKVVSFCLFHLTLYKDNNKWKFKFAGYDGLTGETKIIPKTEGDKPSNPYPYLLYGTVFNTAFIAICLYMFYSYKNYSGYRSDIAYGFLTSGIIALLVVIYNIVPIKLDSLTDGYRLTKATNKEAFNDYLLASYGGETEEIVLAKKDKENKPARFVAEIALNKVYVHLEKEEYEEAFKLLEEIKLHEDELSRRDVLNSKAQYIYAYVFAKDKQEVLRYNDEEVEFSLRRELANESTLPIIRSYILLAGILDGSLSECLLACNKVAKAYKAVPSSLKHTEVVLYNRSIDKVLEARPKWEELSNYKLYE